METGVLIRRLKFISSEFVKVSTRIRKDGLPVPAAVGVPLSTPVDGFRDKPDGSGCEPTRVHTRGRAPPPVAVNVRE
jgi:hypothetical protein